MRKIKLLVLILFVCAVGKSKAQSADFETIMSRGLSDYETGKYEEALSWFTQAFKLDRKSDEACYQLALSHLALKDYTNAAIYSSKVIDRKSELSEDAYLLNGSAWENLGRNKKARRIYNEALKKYPSNYLLHYNLALSFFNEKETGKAQEHVTRAIEIYPAHASSHLLLAYIMFDKGERIKSMLPLYYFLLLEQDSDRSLIAYNMLNSLWSQGVRQKGQRDIQLVKAGFKYDEFASAELAIGMIKASENVKIEGESKISNAILVRFAENNEALFKILKESSKDKYGFYWEFYVNFFNKVQKNDFTKAYSYLISSCRYNDDVLLWMSDHHKEFYTFTAWMKAQ